MSDYKLQISSVGLIGHSSAVVVQVHTRSLQSRTYFPLLIQRDHRLTAAAFRSLHPRLGNMRTVRQLLGGPPEAEPP